MDHRRGLRYRPRTPTRGHALRAWADSCVTREDVCASGCSFGSLAAEIMKSDLDVHDEVAAGFGRWRDLFERGLAAMRERGTAP